MPYYVAEVRDSDGNDCTVYDALILAGDRDKASERLWTTLEKWYPKDESDGGFGTFHACDCHCEHRKTMICSRCSDTWECSHGDLLTDEPSEFEEYQTEKEARAGLAKYHSLIDLSDEEG